MLAIFLAPVYILANVFTAYWLLRWMKEVHPLFRHPAVLGTSGIKESLCPLISNRHTGKRMIPLKNCNGHRAENKQ